VLLLLLLLLQLLRIGHPLLLMPRISAACPFIHSTLLHLRVLQLCIMP
jgi:hypothetical protein